MNHHGITIDETFKEISHSINEGSYNTLDFIFNVVLSSITIAAFMFVIWMAYSFIKIEQGDQ